MTIYSLDVLYSQFGTSLLFHVQFCYFLTCIQISQEAVKVVWYFHLLKNFPQFVVIHTVKGFGVVNETEVDVFLEFSCFFNDPTDVGNLISYSSAFSTPPNSTVSLTSQRHPEKFPEVTGTNQGNPGFPAATRERPRHSSILAWRIPMHRRSWR